MSESSEVFILERYLVQEGRRGRAIRAKVMMDILVQGVSEMTDRCFTHSWGASGRELNVNFNMC